MAESRAASKSDIAALIAEEQGISKAVAARYIAATFDALGRYLAEGTKVSIAGFGTFTVKRRAARTGRNPQTGRALKIPARNAVSFRAGKALKDAV